MTEPSAEAPAQDTDQRLARLAARRAGGSHPPEPAAESTAPAPTPVRAKRIPPARSAKIVTVGASTTAMFGMMAAFAVADRQPSQASAEGAPTTLDAVATIAPPTPSTSAPATTAPAPPPPPAPVPVTAPVTVELATPVTAPATTPPPPTEPPPPPPPPQAESKGS